MTKSRLDIGLQPTWRAAVDGAPLELKGRKTKALVTFLAFERDVPKSRDAIAAMLWPDSPSKHARGSLRQVLSQIRRELGAAADILSTQNDVISFVPKAVHTDFDAILKALEAGTFDKAHGTWLTHVTEMLQAFDGLSETFDDWLALLRDKLIKTAVHALEVRFLSPETPVDQRLKLADVAGQLDEYNEKVVQTQMTCHALQNDNAAALKVYRDFFEKLDAELGGEPSEETMQLVTRIKLSEHGDSSPAAPAEPALRPAPPRPITLVAVLPFERLGATEISQFQVLALLDQITCKIAGFKSPGVISSNSTRHYLDKTPRISEIQQELGVHYVVTGSIGVAGDGVQLSVQMSSVEDHRVHWATTLTCDRGTLHKGSGFLAEEIARAIEPSLNLAELERSEALTTEELEPHHFVLRAKTLMFSLKQDQFAQARQVLDLVQERYPHFGPAHALLAEWYAINLWQGWSGNADTERNLLEEHSRRSVSLSPNDGRALAMWGHNKITLDRDYDDAFMLFDKAMRLSPNDSETLIWTVPTLAYGGNPAQALDNAKKAFSLSPADPFVFRNEHFLAVAHYVNGNYADSAKYGLSCFRRAPNYNSNTRATIAALVSSDRLEEARVLSQHHNQSEPGFSVDAFKDRQGYRDHNDRNNYAEKLLMAGLPH